MKLSLNRRNATIALTTCAFAGLLGIAGAAATSAAYATAAPARHQAVQPDPYGGISPNPFEGISTNPQEDTTTATVAMSLTTPQPNPYQDGPAAAPNEWDE